MKMTGSFPKFLKAAVVTRALIDVELGRVAEQVVEDAKSRVPVRSGRLRDSIKAAPVFGGIEVGPSAFYAALVEFGTAKVPPRPYMMPAAEKVQPEFIKAVQKIGEQALKDAQ
jgi:HK97 gp10 family phage protein